MSDNTENLDLEKFKGHTPGEWEVKRRRHNPIGPEAFEVRQETKGRTDGGRIGLLIANINSGMSDVEANANLIAAAPLLLKEAKRYKAENEELRKKVEELTREQREWYLKSIE